VNNEIADKVITYNLTKTLHFATNKSSVIASEIELLDKNVEWLKNNIDEIVILEGHCDERGTARYNMDLGDRRARWVKSYLIEKGIKPKKIIVISYGESSPADKAHNHIAWKKNRRVFFKLGR